jgi:hypothetical protein
MAFRRAVRVTLEQAKVGHSYPERKWLPGSDRLRETAKRTDYERLFEERV